MSLQGLRDQKLVLFLILIWTASLLAADAAVAVIHTSNSPLVPS